jgi:hypothetical protein
MDDSDSRAARAAAVGSGVFELGGRTFVLSPLTGPDHMAIYAEFRRQCMAASKDPLTLVNERITAAEKAGKPFSPTIVEALVKSAMSASSRPEAKSEPSDAEIAARVNTLEGSQWVVWFRLRKADPSIVPQWVAEHVPDMDTRNQVFHRFAQLDGLTDLDAKKA